MTDLKAISAYIKTLSKDEQEICKALLELIDTGIPKAEGKVWHGHPVWFINENPVVGFSKKKGGLELLFWSGQSFEEDDLVAIGNFKAAGFAYHTVDEVKKTVVKRWLSSAKKIQWDYKNLPKNKKLVKLTEF